MTTPLSVTVSVNGDPREIPADLTLDRLVASYSSAPSGVAAAVNDTVVPRARWAELRLGEGDRIEILTAVQGG
jgi:sulfur carrier protein